MSFWTGFFTGMAALWCLSFLTCIITDWVRDRAARLLVKQFVNAQREIIEERLKKNYDRMKRWDVN